MPRYAFAPPPYGMVARQVAVAAARAEWSPEQPGG